MTNFMGIFAKIPKKKKGRDVRKVYPGSPEHSRRWFPGDFLTPHTVYLKLGRTRALRAQNFAGTYFTGKDQIKTFKYVS
jgi:hypothetical protein